MNDSFPHWGLSRKGSVVVQRTTMCSRFTRPIGRARDSCRINRHLPVDCTGAGDLCTEMPQRIILPAGAAGWRGVVGDRRLYHYFAWTTDGALYGYGAAADGVIAPGVESAPDPVRRPDLPPVLDVAVSNGAACAVSTTGEVWCWGEGADGQLGRGTRGAGTFSATPEIVRWPG